MSPNYIASLGFIFASGLAVAIVFVYVARWVAFRFDLVDRPGGRRKGHQATPRLGAVPLWAGFTVAALLTLIMPVERADPNEYVRFWGLMGGGTFIFLFGLLDDKFDLPWYFQIIGQVTAAAIGIFSLIFIERWNNPLTGETVVWGFALTIFFSMLWLGLMMNTVNFLDGSDGLAGGVILIAAVLLFIHTAREQQHSVSLLTMALIGAMLGFLIFNWHPAKIFMGSGAVYMGYVIGALSIIGGAKMATILLVMGLPLLDVAWQVARRIAHGRNPLKGDRGHLHFRLIDADVGPVTLAVGYHLFCAAFGVLALITTSRQFKFVALVVMVLLLMIGFVVVERRARLRTLDRATNAAMAPVTEQQPPQLDPVEAD